MFVDHSGTLLVDLEERCGEPLSVIEPSFEWLMEHACDLLNKCHVRAGNQIAWESIKRGPYTGDVYRFGAPVMHRLSAPSKAAWSRNGGTTVSTLARNSLRENI